MTITPLGTNVLLTLEDRKTTTASGIALPDTIEKDDIVRATALSVGLDVEEVTPGQTVLVKRLLADPITVDGQKQYLVDVEDIVAIIEEAA